MTRQCCENRVLQFENFFSINKNEVELFIRCDTCGANFYDTVKAEDILQNFIFFRGGALYESAQNK